MHRLPLPDPASLTIQSSSSQDDSLEEALFVNTDNDSKTAKPYSLPSPRLSTIMMDNSADVDARKSASSSRKGPDRGSKKKGLTVSFVEDADKNAGRSGSSKRTLTRHTTQRNLDESLMNSLQSPCGNIGQRYALARKGVERGVFERMKAGMVTGSDPRLGYDWIAGLLDSSGPSLSDRDNDYFNELNEFRKVNYDECHRPKEVL